MEAGDDARVVARRLHALGGEEMIRKAAARELAERDPVEANELLHHLILLARHGWEPASCVLSAFVAALALERDRIPYANELRRIARLQDLDTVAALLNDARAVRELDRREAAKQDAQQFSQSLGH